MTNKEKEQKWVNENINLRTWGWEELVNSDRVNPYELPDGDLKTAFDEYISARCHLEALLEDEYEYEAG